jgi:hypothetical protein
MDRINIHPDLQAVAFRALYEFLRQKMERAALFPPKQHLPAVPSTEPGERRFRGSDYVRFSAG